MINKKYQVKKISIIKEEQLKCLRWMNMNLF